MKRVRFLGLIGVIAAAAFLCAHVVQSQSTKKTLKVTVEKVLPPSCSFYCTSANSDCNTRDSGGVAHLHWNITGNFTSGTISGDLPGSPVTITSPSGSIDSRGSSAYSRTFSLSAAGEGGSCSASATAIYSCFLAGTKILMGDGSYKNIEDVQVGDMVMSYDTSTGKYVGSKVVSAPMSQSSNYYYVNETLKVTPGHPLYVNGAWKMSDQLKVGDQLMNANGELVTVTSIQEFQQDVVVYDLFTEYPNDFFAENFLVHNEKAANAMKDKGLLKGMMIAMADGRELPVEQLKAGDKILAYDAKMKRYAISTVKDAKTQNVSSYKVINNKLKVAMRHQLFIVPAEKNKQTPKSK
ncbi:MAG: hypothetical protein HY922_04285 [Elusimicrobia bacterium]|nr:hypothetical protein [Elusimicrobiota bacterium]